MLAHCLGGCIAPAVYAGGSHQTVAILVKRNLEISPVNFRCRAEHNLLVEFESYIQNRLRAVYVDIQNLVRVTHIVFHSNHRR